MAGVQRIEAEAGECRRSEVADHATRRQRLHQLVGVGEVDRDVAAPLLRIATAGNGDAMFRS